MKFGCWAWCGGIVLCVFIVVVIVIVIVCIVIGIVAVIIVVVINTAGSFPHNPSDRIHVRLYHTSLGGRSSSILIIRILLLSILRRGLSDDRKGMPGRKFYESTENIPVLIFIIAHTIHRIIIAHQGMDFVFETIRHGIHIVHVRRAATATGR